MMLAAACGIDTACAWHTDPCGKRWHANHSAAALESHVLSSTKGCNWVCLKTRCSAQDVAHGLFCGACFLSTQVCGVCLPRSKKEQLARPLACQHRHANAHGTTMKITSEMNYTYQAPWSIFFFGAKGSHNL